MKRNTFDNKLLHQEYFFWSPDYLDASSAWIEHIPFAFWIVAVLKPKSLVELGVHTGTSYFAFCQAVKRMNINTVCYGVDAWKGDEHSGFYGEEVFEKVSNHNEKEFSRFSSLIRSTFDEAKEYFIDKSIDLLHIDGFHTYEAVKHDFEAWLPKLSDNGFVIFHDINVRERNFGVFRLWEELRQQYQHLQFDFGHGLGILSIGKNIPEELNGLLDTNKDEAYYTFLRNTFSERGNFFKNTAQLSEHSKALESRNAQLTQNEQASVLHNAQLSESNQVLALQNAQLSENNKALESLNAQLTQNEQGSVLHNAQLSERNQALELLNSQVTEHNKTLELNNSQLRVVFGSLELENKQLKENYKGLELKYSQQQEKYQKEVFGLLKELRGASSSFNDVSNQLSTIKKENELFQKYLTWYRNTYETRSTLGVLKEKFKQRFKKKIVNPASSNSRQIELDVGKGTHTSSFGGVTIKPKEQDNFELLPKNGITILSDSETYSSIGPDPNFLVNLNNRALKRGWYIFSIEITVVKGMLVLPKLYYDYGHGFNEEDVWNLPPIKGGKIETLIEFPFDISALRFDPTSTDCTFRLTGFHLKWLNKVKTFQIATAKYKEIYAPDGGYFTIFKSLLSELAKTGKLHLRKNIYDTVVYKLESYEDKYRKWCDLFDTISESQFKTIEKLSANLAYQPLFSVVMPVYNAPVEFLEKAIESVRNQAYTNWELCIADDKSTDKEIRALLLSYESRDSRIKVVFREVNGHISNASNSALEIATGDYIALLDQDDELGPHALYMVASAINKNRELELIYSDEDKIDEKDKRFDPYFKTDWNRDLFYGQNMISHLGIYKTSLIKKVGGFRAGYEGSQDYDLALRCIENLRADQIYHIPHVLYHWRAIKGSTAVTVSNKNYAFDAGLKALREHLERMNYKARAEENVHRSYKVVWELPEKSPLVSIIIPTKDKVEVLEACVSSVLEKTDYKNYEILIIDNDSKDFLALAYFKRIQTEFDQVKVYNYPDEFNFSAIVNYGVEKSEGEVVLFLNNDTEVINKEWLGEMVSQCMREEIGAVGAKLFYPNGQIQHAGVFLYEGHPGNHIYMKRNRDDLGYFNKLNLVQNYSAVTAACLAIRKQLFLKAGGFDERNLKVAYNDVDFCLKVGELGYNNLWTPFAQLIHYESLSRGNDLHEINYARFKKEHSYMLNRWKEIIAHDPFFNPNLYIETHNNQFAFPPKVKYEWEAEVPDDGKTE